MKTFFKYLISIIRCFFKKQVKETMTEKATRIEREVAYLNKQKLHIYFMSFGYSTPSMRNFNKPQ